MSDVKVTREHRLEAAACLGGAGVDYWADTGKDLVPAVGTLAYAHPSKVALALAQAEHRVRSAVIADLRGLVERSEFVGPVDYVQADSIRNLIDHLESQS